MKWDLRHSTSYAGRKVKYGADPRGGGYLLRNTGGVQEKGGLGDTGGEMGGGREDKGEKEMRGTM